MMQFLTRAVWGSLVVAALLCCSDNDKDTCGSLEGVAEINDSNDVADFECYTEITGALTINGPDGLTAVELANLQSVGGKLGVYANHDLTAMALPALADVGGSAEIRGNDVLPDLDGLGALESIGGDLVINPSPAGGNAALANIDGLGQLTHVGGNVTITDNPSLPTCAAQALVAQLVNFTGTATISGNNEAGTCP